MMEALYDFARWVIILVALMKIIFVLEQILCELKQIKQEARVESEP